MVKIIEGDLLNATEDIIAHQVNCFVMGRGIAKQIVDKYPNVLLEFKRFTRDCKIERLGRCQIVQVEENKYIANLFGQYRYGTDKQYTRYDCLLEALCELKNEAQFYNKSIALPYYISCGLGNGDIKEVHQIIDAVFWDYNVSLYKI